VHLNAVREDARKRTYEMFTKIDPELGSRIQKDTEALAQPQSRL
jgi:catalase